MLFPDHHPRDSSAGRHSAVVHRTSSSLRARGNLPHGPRGRPSRPRKDARGGSAKPWHDKSRLTHGNDARERGRGGRNAAPRNIGRSAAGPFSTEKL